nr:MAG TPA: hypothetical protein [Caudoviricetes sp.]
MALTLPVLFLQVRHLSLRVTALFKNLTLKFLKLRDDQLP